MEDAIGLLRKAVVIFTQLLMYFVGLALVIKILYPNEAWMSSFGIGKVFNTLGAAGFSGFIAFILFVGIFNYVSNKE